MAFSNPENNIKELGLMPGMRVADLGAGSGFYSLAAARRVGKDGRVTAVDIQDTLLLRLKKEAQDTALGSVLTTAHGDLEHVGGSQLADGSVDAVIVANILFQLDEKEAIAREAARIIKPGGRALVVDWEDSFGNMGPTGEQIVPEEKARTLFEAVGFSFEKRISAGGHHYGLVFRKL